MGSVKSHDIEIAGWASYTIIDGHSKSKFISYHIKNEVCIKP